MSELKIKIIGCSKEKESSIPYTGESIETLSKKVLPPSGGYSAFIGKEQIPKDEWPITIPAENSELVFVPEFGDPGSIALAIMSAAAAPAVGFTGAYLTYAALTIGVSIGISMGAGYLIRALTPKPKENVDSQASPSYSWDPHTTIQKGAVWPRTYGKFKSYGSIKGNYVEVSDDDDEKLVLNMLLDYGYGPVEDLTDIRIDEQPQSNFSDITVETRRGLLEQDPISFFEKIRKQHRPHIAVSHDGGAQEWEIPGSDFDDIEVILQFQLFYHYSSGPPGYISCDIKIEAKEEGESWQTAVDTTVTNLGTTPIWKSYNLADSITINRGSKYTIRITKSSGDLDIDRAKNNMILDYVTEISDDNDALKFPGKVLVGISGLLEEEFTSIQDVSAVIEGLIVNTWDSEEGEWVLAWSDNPAYVALDVLTQPVISGSGEEGNPYVVEEYEGLNPEKINVDDLADFIDNCNNLCPDGNGGTEKLVTFNGIFDKETSVWEALLDVCRIGRCVPIYKGNEIGFVVEKASERVGVLAAGNILDGSFAEEFMQKIDRISEIEVTYNEINKNYERTVMSVPSTSLDTVANKITLDFMGIVKKTEAWRLGRFHLRHNELLKRRIKVKGDIDCLSYDIGSRLGVQFDVPNWGQLASGSRGSGRIIKYTSGESSDVLRLDYNIEDALEYFGDFGIVYELLIRLKNDALVTKEILSVDGDEVTISKITSETKPAEDDLWVAGLQNYVVKDFRLLNRKRNPDLSFDLELIEYNSNIWSDDQCSPLVPNIDETAAKSIRHIVNPPSIKDLNTRVPTIVKEPWKTSSPILLNIEWNDDTPNGDSISWSASDGESAMLVVYQGITYQIASGNTDKKYVYWNKNSTPTSFLSTDDPSDILGAHKWAVCYNDEGTAHPSFGTKLIHADTIQAVTMGMLFARIDYAIIDSAHINNLAVNTIHIADNAVTVSSSAFSAGEQEMDGSTGGAGQETTIQSLAKTSGGGDLQILFGYANNIETSHHVRLYRNSTLLFDSGNREPNYGYKVHWSFQIANSPSAGSYTYYLKIYIPGINPLVRKVKHRSIIILETLK